jgi:hypothetical protein
VPSAISCSQSTCPSSSASPTSRDQTSVRMPFSVHSRRRRRQVDSEGEPSGKSCHRPPFRSSHSSPSSTVRDGTTGLPPAFDGGFHGNRSSIRNQCSSESCRRSSVLDATSYPRNEGKHAGVSMSRTLLSEGSSMQSAGQSVQSVKGFDGGSCHSSFG